MGQKVNLTYGNISTTLTKLALPIMGTSFVQMTYNLTDMFWVGKLGSSSLAAVGTAGFFSWFAFSLILLTKVGAEVFVAQHLGRNDEEGADNYARSAIHFNMMLAVFYGLMLLVFRRQLIAFFNLGDAAVIEMAVGYLSIIASGILFMFINPVLTSIFNGAGDSKTPFLINLTGLAINMVLDPMLIRGWGIFPELGVYGAALATIIAQFLVTILFIIMMITSKDTFFRINIFKKVDFHRILNIFKLGFPVGLQNGLMALIGMVIARIISVYGPEAIAAQKLGSQIESISWMTASGYSTAISAFVGQNYGAKKYERIMKGYASGVRLMSIIGVAATVLLYFLAEPIFKVFITDPVTLRMGVSYLMIIAVSQWFQTLEISNQGAFNGLGKTVYPSFVGVTFNLMRIPMAYFFSQDLGMGLNGVWWAIALSSIFKGLTLFSFFYFLVIRKYRKTGAI